MEVSLPIGPPGDMPDSVNLVYTLALAPFSPTENGLYRYSSVADTFSGTPLFTLVSTFRVDCRIWDSLISWVYWKEKWTLFRI